MKRVLSLLLCYALMFAPLGVYAAESTGTPTQATFTANTSNSVILPNPERGPKTWAGADLVLSFDGGSVTSSFSSGYRISSCRIALTQFRTSAIDAGWLTTLQTRFNSVRAAGMKCRVWFYYDDSNGGNDATSTQIIAHIAQLKPILRTNADIIPVAYAGFVGAYGEWWGSQAGNTCGFQSVVDCATANPRKVAIKNALLDAYHPQTLIMFRYADDLKMMYPTAITASQMSNGTAQSRIGAHNDCPLSGGNDTGTYGSAAGTGTSVATLQAYTTEVGKYVAYIGEIANNCQTPQRLTCAEARADFSRWNWSMLKNTPVDSSSSNWWNQWAAEGCTNEIINTLGYRLILNGISHQSTANRGDSITASVTLRNVGWARVLQPRKIQLVLTNGGNTIVCNSRADLRNLPPQASTNSTITIPCLIPGGAATGTWTAHIRMPDPWPSLAGTAAFAIRPSNTDAGGASWSAANFRWTTGTTVVVS